MELQARQESQGGQMNLPPSNERMTFTMEKRPDQILHLFHVNSFDISTLEKFSEKLEKSEFSDTEFNEYAIEFWDGEAELPDFIIWLEQDLFNNAIFDELKKRREQHEKGNNEQDNNNEGNEDNQVSGNAESGQDGDA
jgi:hypothetical protein